MGRDELKAIEQTFQTGWIGYGPKIKEFEDKFSNFIGVDHSVGLNSATAALHLALLCSKIKAGDEVIVPSLTFVSSVHAILYAKATPVFTDVCSDTLCIDVEDIKRKMTSKTKAIMPVHYSGHPCDMDEIMEIARDNNLHVIEDAAQATGAEYKGNKAGSIGDVGCFSFEAKKNMTTGEGGMLVTNNEDMAKKAKILRWVGIDKSTEARARGGNYNWYYEVNDLGYKYHMNDIQAAMGMVQLSKLEKMNKRREEIVATYNREFSEVEEIRCPVERGYVKSAHWNYVIRVENRDKLIEHLNRNGISAGVHYMPIHMHPFYKNFDAKVPITEAVWKKLVTLPLFVDLSNKDVEKIIAVVRDFFS